MQPGRRANGAASGGGKMRPYSATILMACGLILFGLGLYFMLIRPPFLPEDARYTGAALGELQAVAPGIAGWLRRVFWVLGGYIAATGILTLYIAATSFRTRVRGAGVAVALGGVASIGSMAMVNILIDSDYKWPLVGVSALWGLALALYWRGR